MGYHPGLEDDGLYLAAVKADLNPALFPHNADFFRLQMRGTCFDTWMASFIRLTGMPVAWAELFWQLGSLFLILWAVKMIANQLFAEEHARWAGVAMVAGDDEQLDGSRLPLTALTPGPRSPSGSRGP